MYYDVKGGAVRPLDENTVPANPNTDFTLVTGAHITLYDGETSGAVTVCNIQINVSFIAIDIQTVSNFILFLH